MLVCPIGTAESAVRRKFSIARGILKAGMFRSHLQPGAQAWDALPLDKQLAAVLSPDVMTGSADALRTKKEAIQGFVKAVDKVKGAIGCTEKRFRQEVEALGGCFVQV